MPESSGAGQQGKKNTVSAQSPVQGFVAPLLKGRVNWDCVAPYPIQDAADRRIGDDYIAKVRRVLEQFVDPHEVDRTGEVPVDALLALTDIGAFGLTIPMKYGGLGFSKTNYCRVISYIASYCQSTAAWITAHLSLGAPEAVLRYGNEGQREAFLPRLARGAISALAFREAGFGSDLTRVAATATPSEDGSEFLLRGSGLWCINGPAAEVLIVLAAAAPREEPIPTTARPSLTAFLVEAESTGCEFVHQATAMGLRGVQQAMLHLYDVRVPAENMLGGLGQGQEILHTLRDAARMTTPATATATCKVGLHFARGWCQERVQRGLPIAKHQGVTGKLARMTAECFAMESLSSMLSGAEDRGRNWAELEGALVKLFCTDAARRQTEEVVQIRGKRGYETAESLSRRGEDPIPAERLLRDMRVLSLAEGTGESLRNWCARAIVTAFADRQTRSLLRKHAKPGKNPSVLRTFLPWRLRHRPGPRGRLDTSFLTPANRKHAAFVEKASRRLSFALFQAVARYRQRLLREQCLTRHALNIAIDLFGMSAALSRAVSLMGTEDPEPADSAQELADLFCHEARRRVDAEFEAIRRYAPERTSQATRSFMAGDFSWLMSGVHRELYPSELEMPAAAQGAPVAPPRVAHAESREDAGAPVERKAGEEAATSREDDAAADFEEALFSDSEVSIEPEPLSERMRPQPRKATTPSPEETPFKASKKKRGEEQEPVEAEEDAGEDQEEEKGRLFQFRRKKQQRSAGE